MNKRLQLIQHVGVRVVAALVAAVVISYGFTAVDSGHLHDFISYYYGAVAIAKGLNGYSADVLSGLVGTDLQAHLRFVYPPQMSWIFLPFTLLSFEHARLAFIGIKVGIALGFLAMAATVFRPEKGNRFLFGLIALFGFHSTVSIDIASGNIALLEAALIWGGIALWLKNKPGWGGVLIGIGASFKLTPIVLLGGLALTQHPLRWRAMVSGLLTFFGIQTVGILVYPELYRHFFFLKSPMDSSGFVNPSSLALIRFELAPQLATLVGVSATWIERGLYGGIVAVGIALLSWLVMRRQSFTPVELISAVMLIYALVMPRFKDYTFVLLLIPAWVIVSQVENRWRRWALVALLCVSLSPYHHLVMVGVLLATLLIARGPGSTTIRLSRRPLPNLRRSRH